MAPLPRAGGGISRLAPPLPLTSPEKVVDAGWLQPGIGIYMTDDWEVACPLPRVAGGRQQGEQEPDIRAAHTLPWPGALLHWIVAEVATTHRNIQGEAH